jgi:DNA-binding transcriptional regulator YiaG
MSGKRIASPPPDEIRAAREAAGLSCAQAAELVHCTRRAWYLWEAVDNASSRRAMHPAVWELFRLKTCGTKLPEI